MIAEQPGREKFRDLFDHLPDPLFVHDPEGRFVDVNQAACESLGYTRAELLQLALADVEIGLKPELLAAETARVSEGEKVILLGLHRRKNATTFPVEVHFSLFAYDGRKCFLAAARDISEHKREEERLSRLTKAFEQTSTSPLRMADENNALPGGHGEMVLVVDDEPSLLNSTRQILEYHGYRVLTAEDGAMALAQFTEHKDDVALVMTDLMMPKLDGVSTIQAILKMKPEVKVIAVSGLGVEANLAKSAEAGARHFLCKPYTAKALLSALQKVLRT